jgi:hypothetical protein
LDRAPDYESGGWKFESFRARQSLSRSYPQGKIVAGNTPGVSALDRGKRSLAGDFQTRIELLQEKAAVMPPVDQVGNPPGGPTSPPAITDDVFIVHGHDGQAKAEVQLFLTKAGLRPVVLHDQPNSGRTIIEKFEAHAAAAGFAVVLLTPDDEAVPPADP